MPIGRSIGVVRLAGGKLVVPRAQGLLATADSEAMTEADFLLSVAEVSIAIVTFVALVLVLRQLVGQPLNGFHVLTLQMFAVGGFETMLFSFLPYLLQFAGVPSTEVWRIASGSFALALIATNAWYYRSRRVVAPDRGHHAGTIVASVVQVFAVLIMTLHAFGVIYPLSIAPFAIGLVAGFIPLAAGFLTTIQDFLSSET